MDIILFGKARCILSIVGLPKGFWLEACDSCWRSPLAAIWLKTLLKMWFCNSANFDLRFGCPTYARVIDGKLEWKAKTHLFIGFEISAKIFYSTILLDISRERGLSLWFGFAEFLLCQLWQIWWSSIAIWNSSFAWTYLVLQITIKLLGFWSLSEFWRKWRRSFIILDLTYFVKGRLLESGFKLKPI